MGRKVELLTKSGKPSKSKHGTPTAYKNHGCRCGPCGFAHSNATYTPRPRRVRVPKHGTLHEYRKYKCRCAECRKAKADSHIYYTKERGKISG